MTAQEFHNRKNSALQPSTILPFVAALGTSAGGLQALTAFFEHVGKESQYISYLVIQHIKRDFSSQLASILQQRTRLQVKQAEEGDAFKAGTVLVIPPNKEMKVVGNAITLTERPKDTQINRAIDVLFTSLAEQVGPRSIGVIFSGTGTDGLEGVKAIEKHKGLVLVQEPSTAQFDGMPSHVIHCDNPDHILVPEEMSTYMNAHVATNWEVISKHKSHR